MNAQLLELPITFCVETLADSLPELIPVFPQHWDELALNKDKVPLDPDYAQYLDMEQRGQILFVAGRKAGVIAAYFVGFVRPHIHYRTCLTLAMDIFYIRPEYRGGWTGIKLFRAVEREARQRGVQRAVFGSKMHRDSAALFKRLGYTEIERYFSAWLGA
jgi:GNAT superfamily N-acetyltransferase